MGSGWALNSMTSALLRRQDTERDRERWPCEMKSEAEMGLVPPQDREQQQPPETREGKEGFFPRSPRGGVALRTPGFQTSAS